MRQRTMAFPILTFFIFFLVFPPLTFSNNQTDFLSLLAFKSAMDADPLGALNSWNETTPFCSWNGVRCSRRHPDRVVEIDLMSQGLVGPLSPHIGNLSFLRTIILQNNTLRGLIPAQISLLRRLRNIGFSNNSFTGPIPTNLSQSNPNLVRLNLIDNKLSGTIPVDLGSLSKLEVLGLGTNKLSGSIPPSIGNITSLKRLSLMACGLTGEIPESLAQLQKLFFLQLGRNGLTGTIPSVVFNISTLQFFAVLNNKLNGTIPSTIGLTLPDLRSIYLSSNEFSGPIPASISNASLIENIGFLNNSFTGPIPRASSLTHLQQFIFNWNLIEDDISFISSLTNCTKLKYLEVGVNRLTGSLPASTANLSAQLTALHFHGNGIHGNIPSGIGNLIGLTELFISDNFLDGPLPESITKLSKLQELSLSRNKFTYELPSSLGDLTLLNTLYIDGNNFSGNVPSSLGNCINLLGLDLSENKFSGMIPGEIMRLSSISIEFNLSYNNFEGSIPHEVGSLTSLRALDLSNNRLSGPIPNSLRHCRGLEMLYLNENSLDGEIPSQLGDLRGLQDLDLSRNNLSGPFPSFLGGRKLFFLNISFNRLQGEVPTVGIFRNETLIFVDGNEQLCGGIPELKLPPCSSLKSKKKNTSSLLKILIPMLAGGGIFFVLFVSLIYKKRMYRRKLASSMLPLVGVKFMRLSYVDLLKATSGFAETNLLGVGRFGSVYKGILDDGKTEIAVKVLNLSVRGASKSFLAECNALRDIRHRNLLKILSVCESIDFQGHDFKALIYDFKANGSLEKWLHPSTEESNNLNMIQRLNIATNIAQAIEYLHFGTGSSIVHGDLKPSNILLDQDMTACVGDFGLAKIVSDIVPSQENYSSIGIRGTIGYVPPEYGTNNSVTIQGDVYSYGIILLEMFTNKRPTDDSFEGHLNLHSFVNAALPDRVMEIVDPLLQTDAHMNNDKIKYCMTSVLSIGVSCSKEMPRDRMLMSDVVNELCKIQKLLSSRRTTQ